MITNAYKQTGLLLGAGASYEVGMPLVWELTKELKDWLTPEKFQEIQAEWRLQGGDIPDEVVDDFTRILKRQDLHYESILGYLETQSSRQHGHAQHYHHLYGWLIQMVYFILYYRHVNNREFIRRHIPSYEGLNSFVQETGTLWVFSLNHDLIIEAVAEHFEIPLFTGFGPSTRRFPCINMKGERTGELVAEFLSGSDLDSGRLNYPNPLQRGIYLLKIHGALDQFAINDGKDFVRLYSSDRNDDVIDVLRRSHEELNYFDDGNPTQPVRITNEIAYADSDGVLQFMRRSLLSGAHKFDGLWSQIVPKSMLSAFERNIGYITNLVCIGYGFGDQHINVALRRWLERSAHNTIEIVSPSAASVPDFLLHVAPQVTITASGTFDFLDAKAGIARSRCEQLERAVAAKMRGIGKERAAAIAANTADGFLDTSIKRLVEKVAQLPKVNGQPDFSGVDIRAFAKECMVPLDVSQESILERMLAQIESATETSSAPPIPTE